MNRATALKAETAYCHIYRDELDDAVDAINRMMDGVPDIEPTPARSVAQAGTFEHVEPCPYQPTKNAYVYHGVGLGDENDLTFRLPALADDDEIHDIVRHLYNRVNAKLEARRRGEMV